MTSKTALGRNRYWGKLTPPKNKAEFFNVVTSPAPAGDGEVATIRLYGPIDSWGGWWGVSADEMSATLDALGPQVNQIVLRINSPGGEVFEGLAILNMVRAHKASVTAVVDGLAASAASVIAVGCDETVMSPGTQLMIHDARMYTYGTAADLRKEADILESITSGLIEVYKAKAGDADWAAILAEETWYSASEAVAAKLADSVAVVPDAGPTATPGEDDEDELLVVEVVDPLEADAHHQRRYGATALPAASASGEHKMKGAAVDLNPQHLAALREQVGFAEDADADTIVAAVSEALTERADAPEAQATTTPVIPEGMTLVSTEVLNDLRAGAQDGREARAQQREATRNAALDQAIATGRIAPTQRAHFASLWDADPTGTNALLTQLAPGLVPVSEVGHAGDAENTLTEVPDGAVDAFAAGLGIPKEALRG
ncbi:hypothetical protein GCM10028801_41160 [Nocardioides maradonensis]